MQDHSWFMGFFCSVFYSSKWCEYLKKKWSILHWSVWCLRCQNKKKSIESVSIGMTQIFYKWHLGIYPLLMFNTVQSFWTFGFLSLLMNTFKRSLHACKESTRGLEVRFSSWSVLRSMLLLYRNFGNVRYKHHYMCQKLRKFWRRLLMSVGLAFGDSYTCMFKGP